MSLATNLSTFRFLYMMLDQNLKSSIGCWWWLDVVAPVCHLLSRCKNAIILFLAPAHESTNGNIVQFITFGIFSIWEFGLQSWEKVSHHKLMATLDGQVENFDFSNLLKFIFIKICRGIYTNENTVKKYVNFRDEAVWKIIILPKS